MSTSVQPIQQSERATVVDVLRGFALGGVVIANLASFVTFGMPTATAEAMTTLRSDKIYEFILTVFIDNKFITLFSLLFGYGFGVIMERVSQKDIDTSIFFSRRMTILFIAGALHVFVWWGEVLHVYAFCGIFLLLFRRANNKVLIISAIVLFLIPTLVLRYFQIKLNIFAPAQRDPILEEYLSRSRSQNLIDIFYGNWITYKYIFITCLIDLRDFSEVLAKFLIGYYVLRKGYLKNVSLHVDTIKKVLFWCLPLAILYIGQTSLFSLMEIKLEFIPVRLLLFSFVRIGILSLSVCYACTLILLYIKWPSLKIFSGFRHIGMMSLTNYVTHTLIFIIIFNGVGLGLMGKVHLIYTLPIGVVVYILQAFFSKWWTSKFQYGPVEWLWRQLSYWKRFPIRKMATN